MHSTNQANRKLLGLLKQRFMLVRVNLSLKRIFGKNIKQITPKQKLSKWKICQSMED